MPEPGVVPPRVLGTRHRLVRLYNDGPADGGSTVSTQDRTRGEVGAGQPVDHPDVGFDERGRAVAATQDVGEVDRGRLDKDEHLPGLGNRLWAVFEDQHVGTAEGVGADELHSEPPGNRSVYLRGQRLSGHAPCVNRSVYFEPRDEE